MAKTANTDNVQADMQPPNFRAAVQKIRSIKAKKEKIAGVNGEIADIYAKVEGYKVNKIAARMFASIDPKEYVDRMDIMRSFNGLCDAAGWKPEEADLADMADNKVIPMRMSVPAEKETDGEPFEASDEELAKQAGRGEKAKPAPRKASIKEVAPPSEPYLGDNSDLNPGGNA